MTGGLHTLLLVVGCLLIILIFKGPLVSLWRRIAGDFEHEQELQRRAATTRHGHFYLTIEKYDRETPEVEEVDGLEGEKVFLFGGNEFSSLEAAEFARYNAILAKARGYYTDIDVWTQSLPGPSQFKRRRR